MKRLSKLLWLIMVIICYGKAFGQTNNETEPSIVMDYRDYKFFDDEPDYKLLEDSIVYNGYTWCESTRKFYVVDKQQNIIEYDLTNALTSGIKKRSFHLPFSTNTYYTIKISPDGQLLAIMDENDEYLHIMDASSGKEISSCKMSEEYANEEVKNIMGKVLNSGHPYQFLSNHEVLVSGARKALLYDIEKKSCTTLVLPEKYKSIPKTNITSKGTISGWGWTPSNERFDVTFFVENGIIENTTEGLLVNEYPTSSILSYTYYNKNREYYDIVTGNKIEFNNLNCDLGRYLLSDRNNHCISWITQKGTVLHYFFPGGDSKYTPQQQDVMKKYAISFPYCIPAESGYLIDNKVLFVSSVDWNTKKGRIQFFNHTLTDNEMAKQALRTAIEKNSIDALNQFIEDFPDSRYVSIAKQKKTELEQMQLPLSASNKAKVYRTLPLVGAVAGEFYVGRFTGNTIPQHRSPKSPPITDREMTMIWEFNYEKGRIAFSHPEPKRAGGYKCLYNYQYYLVKDVIITLGNGQKITPNQNKESTASYYDYDTKKRERSVYTLFLPDYKDDKIVISWINTPEQTGKPDGNDYYTVFQDHKHQIDYSLPINVKEAKAYYYFNQAKKASLKDAITYVKDCKNNDYRQEVENEILYGKTVSISDIVYCNDNYPKLTDRLEDKMFGLIGSMSDCDAYLKYYSPSKRGSAIDDKVYQYVSPSNEISDCETYLKHFPNGIHKVVVTAQKNEIASYNAAKRGGKAECTAYLTKYPNGRFTSEIQTKKDNVVKEENRQAQIKVNSNKGIWKLGNKICNCTSDGIIMVTLDQWNEDKSMFKGIVSASPGGLFKGDLLQKGNAVWFEPKDWHKCLDDEMEFSLNHDKSLEAEQLLKAKKMKFARGTVVAHTYYTRGWLFSSSYRITAKVDDWNDDYTRMKIQIIKTDGLDYINDESIYEGKYIWVSPVGWE